MKLYMVLIYMTHIGGVWGPLPYDREECERRTSEQNAQVVARMADPVIKAQLPAGLTAENFRFICVERERRPELGDAAPGESQP